MYDAVFNFHHILRNFQTRFASPRGFLIVFEIFLFIMKVSTSSNFTSINLWVRVVRGISLRRNIRNFFADYFFSNSFIRYFRRCHTFVMRFSFKILRSSSTSNCRSKSAPASFLLVSKKKVSLLKVIVQHMAILRY